MADPIVDAPSIGPKTAERFHAIGVTTVEEFLAADAATTAEKINYRRITTEIVNEWQLQAQLVYQIPNLRGHDAQILVACGFDDPHEITEAEPDQLLALVEEFMESPEGKNALRGSGKPDLSEVQDWIEWSRQARPLQAA